MFILALHDERLHEWASGACEELGVDVLDLGVPPAAPRDAVHGAGGWIVLHDLQPDVKTAFRWLSELAPGPTPVRVLWLDEGPRHSRLSSALRHASTWPEVEVIGVEFRRTSDPIRLRRRLSELETNQWKVALLEDLQGALDLPPDLIRTAKHVLDPGGPTTVAGLLRRAGTSRRRLTRLTQSGGFSRPLAFLHAVRILGIHSLLQEGRTVRQASERLRYADPDRAREHFRKLLNLTPSEARDVDRIRLLRRIEARSG